MHRVSPSYPSVFPWDESHIVEGQPPLALVARAAALLDALEAAAADSYDQQGRALLGISEVLTALGRSGSIDEMGKLLRALEILAPIQARERWPLAQFVRQMDRETYGRRTRAAMGA